MKSLKTELRQAAKIGDADAKSRIKELMGEEKSFNSKQKQTGEERIVVKKLK